MKLRTCDHLESRIMMTISNQLCILVVRHSCDDVYHVRTRVLIQTTRKYSKKKIPCRLLNALKYFHYGIAIPMIVHDRFKIQTRGLTNGYGV